MNFIPDPANAIVGVLSIIAVYFISRSGKEDAKKFADAAQKAANEAEKNRRITQRAELIPHFVSVKKMLKAFDEKRQLRVGELRAMQDSLSHLFTASDKFDFLKPIEPLVEELTNFVRLSQENNIADYWCVENQRINELGLKNLINDLERLRKELDLEL